MDQSQAPVTESGKAAKTLRWIVIVIGSIALLIVLFYSEEDLRGASAWNSFKRAQAAVGESFRPADFVPAAVPDDQNFAMSPVLQPALDYTHTKQGTHWRDKNAWQRLSRISIDLEMRGHQPPPKITGVEQGTVTELEAFARFYRGNTNYPQSAHPGNAAEDVLTALSKFDPELKELQEAAAMRPKSRFPIQYSYEPPFEILLPHLAPVKGITSVCVLRALAELDLHRANDAFADLQLGFRMSDSIREEPFLIDHLVRISCLNLTLSGVREGLARHAWSDAQLMTFETNLANLDLLSEYEHTMRGERAFNVAGLEYFRHHGAPWGMFGAGVSPANRDPSALSWMPGGWYQQNMLVIGECYRDYILPSVDLTNRTVLPRLSEPMAPVIEHRRTGPYNVFAKLLIPAFAKASQRSARAQTAVDEAYVACALERYRLEHHDLPDTLDSLVPEFIAKIPNDLFDGKPLRYKKTGADSYVLYSIGWNQRDDGGNAVLTPGSTPHEDPNSGDWVWQMAAR